MLKKKLKLLVRANQELGEESFQIINDQHAFALSGGLDTCSSKCRKLTYCHTHSGSCQVLEICSVHTDTISE